MFEYVVKQDNVVVSQGILYANSKDDVTAYLKEKFGHECIIKVTDIR